MPFFMKTEVLIECTAAFLLIGFISFQTVRIFVLKRATFESLTVILSLISVIFGFYVWIKYGMIIEYGTSQEASNTNAFLLFTLGFSCFFISIVFLFLSILKYFFIGFGKYIHKLYFSLHHSIKKYFNILFFFILTFYVL